MPRIHFQLQLAELKDKLLAMAAMAQLAVESAVDAYLQRDQGLCRYLEAVQSGAQSIEDGGARHDARRNFVGNRLEVNLAVQHFCASKV